jgi:hypothetical protein
MDNHHELAELEKAEARDILYVAGGAALILLGAGLAMANPGIRKTVKAALMAVAPDLEAPLKAGVRGMMPDFERYLKMKGM